MSQISIDESAALKARPAEWWMSVDPFGEERQGKEGTGWCVLACPRQDEVTLEWRSFDNMTCVKGRAAHNCSTQCAAFSLARLAHWYKQETETSPFLHLEDVVNLGNKTPLPQGSLPRQGEFSARSLYRCAVVTSGHTLKCGSVGAAD